MPFLQIVLPTEPSYSYKFPEFVGQKMEDKSVKKSKKKAERKAKKLRDIKDEGLATGSGHLKVQPGRYKSMMDKRWDAGVRLPRFQSRLHYLHCIK